MPIEINENEIPDFNTALPQMVATIEILEVTQEPSKSHAPMDLIKFQILAPDNITHAGQLCAVAGRTGRQYVSYSKGALVRSVAALRKVGLAIPAHFSIPTAEEVQSKAYTTIPQIQSITAGLKGCRFLCRINTEPQYETDTGRWDGKPKLDENGQKIVRGYDTVIDLGRAESKLELNGAPFTGGPF